MYSDALDEASNCRAGYTITLAIEVSICRSKVASFLDTATYGTVAVLAGPDVRPLVPECIHAHWAVDCLLEADLCSCGRASIADEVSDSESTNCVVLPITGSYDPGLPVILNLGGIMTCEAKIVHRWWALTIFSALDETVLYEVHWILLSELGSAAPMTAVDVPVCNTACLSAGLRTKAGLGCKLSERPVGKTVKLACEGLSGLTVL